MIMRYKRPDKKNALSILHAAKNDLDFTLSLPLTEKASSTIVRNIYESFRMLGYSLLVSKGIASKDHNKPIQELLKIQVTTKRPLYLIDHLRKLRHNINYYGCSPSLKETKDIINFAECCFKPLHKKIIEELKD